MRQAPLSAYERLREETIQRNAEIMRTLGLTAAHTALVALRDREEEKKAKAKATKPQEDSSRKRKREAAAEGSGEVRQSMRLRKSREDPSLERLASGREGKEEEEEEEDIIAAAKRQRREPLVSIEIDDEEVSVEHFRWPRLLLENPYFSLQVESKLLQLVSEARENGIDPNDLIGTATYKHTLRRVHSMSEKVMAARSLWMSSQTFLCRLWPLESSESKGREGRTPFLRCFITHTHSLIHSFTHFIFADAIICASSLLGRLRGPCISRLCRSSSPQSVLSPPHRRRLHSVPKNCKAKRECVE
jgi:hypothetical protein